MDSAADDTIETLSEQIARLVRERQALRAEAGDSSALERNRREIGRLQHALSEALIRRFGPTAA